MKKDDNQAQLLCESLERATLYSKLTLAEDVKLKKRLRKAEEELIERARKIMALQKRLERAFEQLQCEKETRVDLEERLECAEENLANVLSHQNNPPQKKSVHWSKTLSVVDASDESDSD
jgi:hypothetical protein